jgi:hypothetical protein
MSAPDHPHDETELSVANILWLVLMLCGLIAAGGLVGVVIGVAFSG